MALKYKIKSLDGLAEHVAKLYTKSGEEYQLDVEGIDDGAELKRAKDHEKAARKDAEKKLAELNTELETLREERDGMLRGAVPKADVDKLEASWKGKLTKRENELAAEVAKYRAGLEGATVEARAVELATKISVAPKLLLPIIRARIRLEESNGQFTTRVLDQNGQPSASTVDDLEKELLANKEFAPILIGSKGSGGGANGSRSGGGASNSQATVTRSQFDAMSTADKAAHFKAGGDVVDDNS